MPYSKEERQQESAILGDEGAERYAFNAHCAVEGEPYAGCYINSIYCNIYRHRPYSILHTYKKALEGKVAKCCRGGPYSYKEIVPRKLLNLWRALYKGKGTLYINPLYCPYYEGDDKCGEESLHQDSGGCAEIAAAVCLRHHTGGANPQKAQIPVEQVKEHCGNGNAANHCGISYMTCHCKVHQPHQRNGYIGKDIGYGKPENAPVIYGTFHLRPAFQGRTRISPTQSRRPPQRPLLRSRARGYACRE